MDRETFIKALEIVVSKTNIPNGSGIDLESICTDFALLAYDEALILHNVSISNRVELNYLDSKYEVKWLINDVYQVEQDGNCIYQDTETGCNEYLKGLLGY